jgi:hypothetical protein
MADAAVTRRRTRQTALQKRCLAAQNAHARARRLARRAKRQWDARAAQAAAQAAATRLAHAAQQRQQYAAKKAVVLSAFGEPTLSDDEQWELTRRLEREGPDDVPEQRTQALEDRARACVLASGRELRCATCDGAFMECHTRRFFLDKDAATRAARQFRAQPPPPLAWSRKQPLCPGYMALELK